MFLLRRISVFCLILSQVISLPVTAASIPVKTDELQSQLASLSNGHSHATTSALGAFVFSLLKAAGPAIVGLPEYSAPFGVNCSVIFNSQNSHAVCDVDFKNPNDYPGDCVNYPTPPNDISRSKTDNLLQIRVFIDGRSRDPINPLVWLYYGETDKPETSTSFSAGEIAATVIGGALLIGAAITLYFKWNALIECFSPQRVNAQSSQEPIPTVININHSGNGNQIIYHNSERVQPVVGMAVGMVPCEAKGLNRVFK